MKTPAWPRWPLSLALAAALLLKITLLLWLWNSFFSTPQAKKMRMPTSAVEQHLLASAPPPPQLTAQARP